MQDHSASTTRKHSEHASNVCVQAGGDGPSGARWRLSERQLLSIARRHLTPLLENLRLLVVAFDNMREEDRNEISTVEEIVNNRDWHVCCNAAVVVDRRAPVQRNSADLDEIDCFENVGIVFADAPCQDRTNASRLTSAKGEPRMLACLFCSNGMRAP